jgi:hypothetical protein
MPEILKADGYDDCVLGGVLSENGVRPRLVYDANKIIQKMIKDDGMPEEEAIEYFEFNTLGSYVGDGTPWFFYPVEKEDIHSLEEVTLLVGFDDALLGTLSGCAVETTSLYKLSLEVIRQNKLVISDKGPFFLVEKPAEEDLDEWVDKYLEGGV